MNKRTIVLLIAASALLSSCEFLRSWADAASPEPGTVPPAVPSGGAQLPQVGGSDPWDLLVTVLTVLGLAPAARLASLAKPLIAPLIIAILGRKKKAEEPAPPSTPPVS